MDPAKKDEKEAPAQPAATPAAAPAEGNTDQAVPKDALSKTDEELAKEQIVDATNGTAAPGGEEKPPKKPNAMKKFFKKVDIYLATFVLIIVISGAFTIVSYLNSKKTPKTPTVATQPLTQSALKSLSNADVTVGNSAQTLTVQGNAIFSGQVLIRSNLNVAGTIQTGTNILSPEITISGTSNLATTQTNTLQVATSAVVQGPTSLQALTVSGDSTFNEPITASQITVTTLILSGNATLNVPNHIEFTGPPPSHDNINSSTLGAGGTLSINGSDTEGTVNINTGNGPIAGCFLTVNFAAPFTSTPHVIISPVDAGAAEVQYYVTLTDTTFSICSDNAPPANQVFAYDYFVTS